MTDTPGALRLVLTPGEPAGVGPDLVIRLAAAGEMPANMVIVADPDLLLSRADQLHLNLTLSEYDPQRPAEAGTLAVLPRSLPRPITAGKPDPGNAEYVLATLEAACRGCLNGQFAAMVTGPVHKSVINEAGFIFSGHTEFLAGLCGAVQTVMLLTDGSLRVALATTHLPLREVAAAVTRERLRTTLQILHDDLLHRFAVGQPRIGVLGLNPHAGESGHLGREEIDIIQPLIDELRQRGWRLQGPLPADTAFTPAVREQYDAVLAMYHDQGLPALKAGGFGHTVNITLGLPIIRTSVDHGTALNLAGTGRADPGSLRCAIHSALELARRARR